MIKWNDGPPEEHQIKRLADTGARIIAYLTLSRSEYHGDAVVLRCWSAKTHTTWDCTRVNYEDIKKWRELE